MVREIQHLIEQMTDEERRQYLSESLFLNTVSYENERLGAYMKKLTKKDSRPPSLSMSLNYLATRFTCSWPWSTMVMLCDGRMVCGCADPYGKRVLGDAQGRRRRRRSGPASAASRLRRELNAGGSKFCGDCPLKLPLEEGRRAARARSARRAAAVAPLHRVHRGLQHLLRPGVLRAGDRHHAHAPGRHARLRAVPPRDRRGRARRSCASTSSTTARRFCTSARSRCASTSRRTFRTSISTRAPTASPSPRSRSGGSCTRASTRSPSRSTARPPRATPGTGSAAISRRRSANLRAAADEKRAAPGATCRSSTGATSCSPTTTAMRR